MLASISPERLAEILDVAEDGIITVDAQQRIVLFNRGAANLFGYHPSEVLGQPLDLLIPTRFRGTHSDDVKAFAAGPVAARPMGLRRVVTGLRKDGTEFPAEVTICKLVAEGDLLLTAIVRDAVERKKYETALLQLNQELEERVRQRTSELAERNLQLMQKTEENEMFVYSVSHDLRSPLVNLEGFSQELQLAVNDLATLLSDDRIPSDIRSRAKELLSSGIEESVGFIRTAVNRLGRIIDALLRLSRAGRVEYRLQLVDVQLVAQRVVDSLRSTAAAHKAEVVIGTLPPAWGDPDAVEQILANLVSNALKYLDPARPGRVEIGSPPPSADQKTLTYFVRDNGVGIPAAYSTKLFQAFQRLHPDKAPGEGIGLAIVRRVLERLGGTIAVESRAGEGTIFTFTLPAESSRHP